MSNWKEDNQEIENYIKYNNNKSSNNFEDFFKLVEIKLFILIKNTFLTDLICLTSSFNFSLSAWTNLSILFVDICPLLLFNSRNPY